VKRKLEIGIIFFVAILIIGILIKVNTNDNTNNKQQVFTKREISDIQKKVNALSSRFEELKIVLVEIMSDNELIVHISEDNGNNIPEIEEYFHSFDVEVKISDIKVTLTEIVK